MRLPSAAWILGGILATLAAPTRAYAEDPLWAAVEAFRSARYDDARVAFERLRDANHGVDYGAYLGPTYYKLGRFEEARAALAPAYRRGDQDPVATYYLGLAYYRLGFSRLARSAFDEVIRSQPGPKLSSGAQKFLDELKRTNDHLGTEAIAAFAANLQAIAPDLAFDYALEAELRATTPSETATADALLSGMLKGRFTEARPLATKLAGHSLPGPVEPGRFSGGVLSAPRFYMPALADRL